MLNKHNKNKSSLSDRTEKKLNLILAYKIWSTILCTVGVIIWLIVFYYKILPTL